MCIVRGEIYMARLAEDEEGSLQSGIRPVLIVSNNKANEYSPVITVLPLTSNLKKKKLPTHVAINGGGIRPSLVLAEQIMSLNQSRLIRKMGKLRPEFQGAIKKAIEIQLSL